MAVTKWNPKELALGKAQGRVMKCLKSLHANANWNNLKTTEITIFFSSNCTLCLHIINVKIPTERRKFTGI